MYDRILSFVFYTQIFYVYFLNIIKCLKYNNNNFLNIIKLFLYVFYAEIISVSHYSDDMTNAYKFDSQSNASRDIAMSPLIFKGGG